MHSFTSRLRAFLSGGGPGPAAPRRARRSRPALERLEERQVLSGYTPTPQEQLFLERLNDARANPTAYGQSIGVDLSAVPASQPLAFDTRLIQSSRDHSQDMNDHNYFGHTGSDGSSPFQRMTADGFPWVGAAESIAAGQPTPEAALQALITDAGVADLGHRKQLLSWGGSPYTAEQETGVGIVLNGTGAYHNYYTIDSGNTADTRPFLTGVVFNDANNNGLYDLNEGLGGVTITVAGVTSFTTWSSGGYSYQLNPGTYTVTASGGGLSAPITKTVTVGAINLRLNFVNGTGGGGGGTTQFDNDSGTGFSTVGPWTPFAGQGYLGDVHFAAAGNGGSVATWSFTVTPGQYLVSATWSPYSNRATNAPYTVLDGSTPLGTFAVNQQQTPSDLNDAGVGWKNLGTFNITGTTLNVTLTNAANGYVIADGIRVEYKGGLPSGPVAKVSDGGTTVANGGSDSFGTTPPGTPVTRTFTVTNAGSSNLVLSDPITLPPGFSLVSDFGSTTVAPGASTTFTVRLTAATQGNYSGTLSFGTNDPKNNPYSFTISGTVASTAFVDDGDAAGFGTSGPWTPFGGQGFHNNVHFAAAGNGGSVATWTFTVTPGQYLVSATWSANPNRATNAPYTVLDGNSPLSGVAVNQQLAPSDRTDFGVGWKDLGTFAITGTTLTVTLTDAANGYVIADAIRVEYKGGLPSGPVAQVFDGGTPVGNGGSDSFGSTFAGVPVTRTFTVTNAGSSNLVLSDPITLPPGFSLVSDFGSTTVAPGASTTFAVRLTAAAAGSYGGTLSFGTNDPSNNPYAFTVSGTVTAVQIGDDGSPSGFSTSGSWTPFSGQGYGNNVHFAAAGNGSSVATWTFTGLPPGTYEVSATWSPDPNRATNAPYTVTAGGNSTTVTVNQTKAPDTLAGGFDDQGTAWMDLGGPYVVTGANNTLTITLSNNANGYVIADAIRIKKVG